MPELSNFDRVLYTEAEADSVGAYVRNRTWTWESRPDTDAVFYHYNNRYGFRGAEWAVAKPAGKQRVLFIGDSFVEGVMSDGDHTIPATYAAAVGTEQCEIMNAGILGTGLDSYLQLTSDMLPLFKPDRLFFCVYANDLGKQPPPVPDYYLEPEYFGFWKPRLLEVLQENSLHGPVPFRLGGGENPFLPAVPDSKNPWTDHEAELTHRVTPALAAQMKTAEFNPFRVDALAKEARFLRSDPQLGETLPYLAYICQKFKVQPIVVYIPSRNQVTDHYLSFEREYCLQCPDSLDLTGPEYQLHARVIAGQCQQFGLPFLDLTPEIREHEARGDHLYWNYDEHMRARGYVMIGQALARYWKP